eukprot:TRINITY_DN7264_c0_g1_i1.p1 TRINITY_DN7264_c0_g1~~TRINITY_DN7264_c0_g1_i1.p1  ORF type:complete len:363 (-),score=92.05 TRINITY_DN7264_c0_g1_i1:46-1134(-)
MDAKARKNDGFWKQEQTGQTDRVRQLNKQRDKERQEFEDKRKKIEQENNVRVTKIDEKFAGNKQGAYDQLFTEQTTGLVTKEEYAEKRELLGRLLEEQEKARENEERAKERARKAMRKSDAAVLSFALEEDEEGAEGNEEAVSREQSADIQPPRAERGVTPLSGDDSGAEGRPKRRKFGKDPTIFTAFLPDKDREEEDTRERERLKREWLKLQEEIKKEELVVQYSYWDGKGNRRKMTCQKGWTVARFLSEVQKEFKELQRMPVDNLMFIKEDIILPHTISFYDLIVSNARGKSGPLTNFEAYDDVRVQNDASIEKNESHVAKVVDRKWYERNQHIFPASRWVAYDPARDYGAYTVRGPGKA